MKPNSFFLAGCTLLILFASCRGTRPAAAKMLPVIHDINELPDKAKAMYVSPTGEKLILSHQPEIAESDEIAVMDSAMDAGPVLMAAAAPNKNCDATGCPDNCNFDGKKRPTAKTTISTGTVKTYRGVKHFLDDFADKHPDKDMKAVIAGSDGRVQLEDFNAVIKKAWLFCYAKETDEDFHLVIGNIKNMNSPRNRFIIVEVGGLPKTSLPWSAATRPVLAKVLADFFTITKGTVCKSGYIWFDEGNAPRRIRVEGSIYWDTEHWSDNNNALNHHGPKKLADRLTTAWEIHPITEIKEIK